MKFSELSNSLPTDTTFGMSKFKASAEDKFGVAEMLGFVIQRVENIMGKGENASNLPFLLFYTFKIEVQVFRKNSSVVCKFFEIGPV